MSLGDVFERNEVRYFQFNKIYVLETLHEGERRTGKELFDDLLNRTTYRHGWFDSSYEFVKNNKQLFKAISRTKQDALAGLIFPFIHIEGHGNTTGLETGKGATRDIVKWQDLATAFRKINVATKNNLMLSIASCYGSHIYKGIRVTERAPFFGFIAPLEKVSPEEIVEGYNTFYDRIINTDQFDDAVLTLRGSPPRFTYIHCETAFRMVCEKMSAELQDPVERTKSLLGLVTRSLHKVPLRLRYTIPQIVELSDNTLSKRDELFNTWLDNFIMRDLQ